MPISEKRGILERMVFHGIVFNMSWEDPEMDRRALKINGDDTVISITSAGCNPLNFLCQSPKGMISVDGNPAQNSVLELKLAAINSLRHDQFADIFAARNPGIVADLYSNKLRSQLSDPARDFWDENLWMARRGLYNYGRMGIACRIVRFVLPILGIRKSQLEELFELTSLEEQEAWYRQHAEKKLWRPMIKRLCKSRWFMYLCGVHPHQYNLVHDQHDMYDFVKERLEYVFTKVPIYDNYFMSVTVTGRFRGNRVPPYLLEENFETLRENLDRAHVVYGWLGPFLDTREPGSIEKFNLLDIFDWMPPEVLESTWQSILRAAAPGATMIFRSGPYHMDLPDSVEQHLNSDDETAREILKIDRSATYGGFYIKHLKPGHEHESIRTQAKHAPALASV